MSRSISFMLICCSVSRLWMFFFFFKQKTAYEIGLGIPAEPLFRSADYFDFERIEALKPAIEACGISTLSQSPMLGFHKQMDNRMRSASISGLRRDAVQPDIEAERKIGRASCRERVKNWRVAGG